MSCVCATARRCPADREEELASGGDGGDCKLAKLRRFLSTLLQFGRDIGPEAGDRVRDLVRRLLTASLTLEEFQSELQRATNFPLRPFVIPFLRSSLPLMQQDVAHLSAANGQPVEEVLSAQRLEEFLQRRLAAKAELASGGDSGRKRRLSVDCKDETKIKRRFSESLVDSREVASETASSSAPASVRHSNSFPTTEADSLKPRLHQLHRQSERPQSRRRSERPSTSEGSIENEEAARFAGEAAEEAQNPGDEEAATGSFQRLESTLAAVANLVAGARSSLATLRRVCGPHHQEQQQQQQQQRALASASGGLAASVAALMEENSGSRSRRGFEGAEKDLAQQQRQQQQRQQQQRQQQQQLMHLDSLVTSLRRQAQQEARAAVAAAEARAEQLLAAERLRSQRMVARIREEALAASRIQVGSAESCWNCGRIATETCSGCSAARYCGSFCQHRDWDRHRAACGLLAQQDSPSLGDSEGGGGSVCKMTGSAPLEDRSPLQ